MHDWSSRVKKRSGEMEWSSGVKHKCVGKYLTACILDRCLNSTCANHWLLHVELNSD